MMKPVEIKTWDGGADSEFKIIGEDDSHYKFTGYIARFGNEDRVGDVIEPGAFKRTLQHNKGTFPLVWLHDRANIIGGVQAREDAKGLLADPGFLIKGIPQAETAYRLLKEKIVRGMSFAYRTIRQRYDGKVNHLLELAVSEATLAPVSMIANPEAQVISVKTFCDNYIDYMRESIKAISDTALPLAARATPWDAGAAAKRVRAWASNSAGEVNWDKYRRAFLWYDPAKRNQRAGYKLGYGDVIRGRLYAIPRAIIAIAGVLMGARGGVDISQADQRRAKNVISAYYKRMGMVAPWDRPKKTTYGPLDQELDYHRLVTRPPTHREWPGVITL